ncbi:peptide-methionine (R)-S-oxide reductase [Mucilaginibacter sp. UYCu711]|uniref:peptide-methionine (R)-S-oxide reductase n=1 Tax=Mucilaginibacter sp. UYCu711 TaxID=3156339 RepID=UPI003D2364D5
MFNWLIINALILKYDLYAVSEAYTSCTVMLYNGDRVFEPVRKNSVIYKTDTSYNMERIEVICARCDSHLGHLFDDGPPPTHKRFCVNSIVMDFQPDGLSK